MSRKGRLKRALAIVSLPVLAVAVWLVVGDRVMAGGRVLHVVNRTNTDASIRIHLPGDAAPGDEVTRFALKPGERREVLLAEGRYSASVEREGLTPAQVVAFTLEGSFGERLLDRTAFVLNVGSEATFLWEQEEYGIAPSMQRRPDRVHFGEQFFVLRDVDYAFEPFPEKVDSGGGTVLRSRLSVLGGTSLQALWRFAKDDPRALEFAERHLSPAALDESLLAGYLGLARARGLDARALEFLKASLSPVSIPWHRAYQDRVRASVSNAESVLCEDYARRLSDAPKDARLLYLRGRVAGAAKIRERYYRDALKADPECAYAHHALAVLAYRRGEHEDARRHAAEAVRLRPLDAIMIGVAYRVRFVLGDCAALSAENQARRLTAPADLFLLRRALELAAAQSDAGRGKELLQEYRQAVRSRLPKDPQQLVLHSELLWLALEQKATELDARASDLTSPAFRARVLFEARLEAGDPEAAEAALGQAKAGARWTRAGCLWLSVAWRRKGDSAAEARWREQAITLLGQGSPDEVLAAAMLRDDARDLDRILELALSSSLKACLLLALGKEDPPFEEAAKRFDETLYFPHRILNR